MMPSRTYLTFEPVLLSLSNYTHMSPINLHEWYPSLSQSLATTTYLVLWLLLHPGQRIDTQTPPQPDEYRPVRWTDFDAEFPEQREHLK